MEYYLPWMDCK